MREKSNYLKEAAAHPTHRLFLIVAAIASVAGLWRGSAWPLVLFAIAEALVLLVVPRLPAFRQSCDQRHAEEREHQRRVELEQIASRLSPNAKSRLDGIVRTRNQILDSLRTLSESRALEATWAPRLASIESAALRILVSVDSTRADARDRRFLESDVKELEAKVAAMPEGAARAAQAQRLELARRRVADQAKIEDQRQAAIAQLETIEDLLQDLLSRGLAGRDSEAFAGRIDGLALQIDASSESVASLDRHAETEAELAALKSGR
jgi:hypothetical protein